MELPTIKIIINSVLSSQEYKHYSALKDIARNLGFRYIWHKEGKYLVKRKTGDKSHYFTSAEELRAIWACYSDRDDNDTVISIREKCDKNKTDARNE